MKPPKTADEVSLRSIPPADRRRVESVLIDTSDVARLLSMSTSWVYREASKLGLKGYKLGRGRNAKILYKKNDVLRWLEQQRIH